MLLDTDFDEQVPALSPDGRWIAYQSDLSGRPNIFVKPFPNVDDGGWQVSIDGGLDPVWSPDGRRLFFLRPSPRALMIAAVVTDPTFSRETPTELFSLEGFETEGPGGPGRRYDLAPDGERFVFIKPAATAGIPFRGFVFVTNCYEDLLMRRRA
jgi:hypothetical protein